MSAVAIHIAPRTPRSPPWILAFARQNDALRLHLIVLADNNDYLSMPRRCQHCERES